MYNFYNNIKVQKTINPNYKIHKLELPFRSLVCCGSGGGKSNLVMNLLYYLDRTLHKIIICTKAPEDLYDYLIKKIDDVEIHYEGFIPEFQKMNKGENALIIFDDLVLDKNPQIAEMFIRGRKLGYSLIFISQSYYTTPKIIRQNVNYIFLGRGLHKRDLNTILGEFAMGLEKEELEKLYSSLTREQMNFMFIDFLKRNIRHNITDIILEF